MFARDLSYKIFSPPRHQDTKFKYKIIHLNRVHPGRQKSRIGYIIDAAIFATFWQAFKPDEKTPEVDSRIGGQLNTVHTAFHDACRKDYRTYLRRLWGGIRSVVFCCEACSGVSTR